MVQGTVRRINNWKNGKGFFFLLNEVEGEWFAYGLPTFKVGDHVQFEPMGKKLNKATQVKFGKAKEPCITTRLVLGENENTVEEFFDSIDYHKTGGVSHQISKDETITRLACLKAAASCMSGNGKELTSEAIANHTKTIADIFVKWVRS